MQLGDTVDIRAQTPAPGTSCSSDAPARTDFLHIRVILLGLQDALFTGIGRQEASLNVKKIHSDQ